MSETFGHLEQHRGRLEQVRENSTRPGRAWATYQTVGIGGYAHPTVFEFGCGFLEQPIFTFGVALRSDQALPDAPEDYPRCTAGVYHWKRSPNGLFTGAWCWFTVDTGADRPNLCMVFSMAWEGVASKDFISTPGFPVYALDV